MRTRSPRNHAANATVISGAANEIAVASTSGSRASAAKLRNMPAMLMAPRSRWPSGRSVRMTSASSRRQTSISSTGTIAKAGGKKGEQERRERLEQKGFDQVHRAAQKNDALLSRGIAISKAISVPV